MPYILYRHILIYYYQKIIIHGNNRCLPNAGVGSALMLKIVSYPNLFDKMSVALVVRRYSAIIIYLPAIFNGIAKPTDLVFLECNSFRMGWAVLSYLVFL